MMMNNHYDVLNVSPSATFDEIKTAYYKAARQFHPDKKQQHQQRSTSSSIQRRCQSDNNNNNQDVNDIIAYNDDGDNNNNNNKINFVTINQIEQSTDDNHSFLTAEKVNDENNNNNNNNENNNETFRMIQMAWECLRDSERRKLFDLQLQSIRSKRNNSILLYPNDFQEVEVEEKVVAARNNDDNDNDERGIILKYTCRCGYGINSNEFVFLDNDDGDEIIHCPGCSLTYNIKLLL